MDRFLVKTERSKTERKKRKRVVLSDDDDVFGPAANLLPRRTGEFMEQLAAFIAHENDLVKLSDDGNKATYGKPSGDDVYMCEAGGAFVKVEGSTSTNPFDDFSLTGGKRRREEAAHEKTSTQPLRRLFAA